METKFFFIVGCPRTGTSLLRQILNRSESICIAPETHFIHRFSKAGQREKHLAQIGPLSENKNIDKFVDFVYTNKKISTYWQWLKRNVDKESFKQKLLESDRTEQAIFTILMQIYADETQPNNLNTVLGEKTPAHLYYIPTLIQWFPEAKIIHTFRDPRAITASRLKKIRQKQIDLKSKFPALPGWILDPIDIPLETLRMSYVWFSASRLHAQYQQRYPRNYLMIKYEDLITLPEKQLSLICDFLGIEFEQKFMDEVLVFGSSYQAKQRGPSGFDKMAINRWKDTLNPLTKTWFATIARKRLKEFGYIP